MTTARRGALGLPMLEIGIIVALVGIFFAILRHQLLYYWELAERTTVQLTISNMRTGLRLEMARRLMNKEPQTIPALTGLNPMHLLETPDHYLGERPRVDPARIPPGHWVYSRHNGHLYYVPRYKRYLRMQPEQKLVFLEFVLESIDKSAEASANKAAIPGDVRLVSVRPYQWF